jgi:hypothetical protein
MSVSKDSVELCQYPLLISHSVDPVHCDLNSLFLSKYIIALVRKTHLTIKSTFLLRFGCIGGDSAQGVLHTTNLWTTWIWLKSMISEKMLVLRLLLILCPRLDLGILLSVRDWGGFFLDAHCEGMINGYSHVMVVLQLQCNCRKLKDPIVYFSHWDHPCLAQALQQQSMVVHFFWLP